MTTMLPHVYLMGVINVTPDSFSDGGEFTTVTAAIKQARTLTADGAHILDIGGESTRPGAERVSVQQEIDRVVPVIRGIVESDWFSAMDAHLGAPAISIDTMNHQTAIAAVEAGASYVNDVSGGLADLQMFEVVAALPAKLIIGHWRGHSTEMDSLNQYGSVVADVVAELSARATAAETAGVSKHQIYLDPGLGFAKDAGQNWELLAGIDQVKKLGYPILLGASRKRFLASALDEYEPALVDNTRRDIATAVLSALLAQRGPVASGIWGLRVHNVGATRDALAIADALRVAGK